MNTPSQKVIFSNVASCAFQRWASFDSLKGEENHRRAKEEQQTAMMALALAFKHS